MLLEERRGSVTIWKGGISDESSWVPSKSSKADLMDLVRAGLLPSKEMICWRTVGADLDPSVWLSETALFVPFVRRGLALPACNFLLGLLYYYGIELHNFDPEAILHISIFVYFCEAFLGIPLHFILFCYLFCIFPHPDHKNTRIFREARLRLRPERVNEYIPYPALGSTNGWETEWFYLGNPYPPLPRIKNKAPEYVLEWICPGPEADDG